MSNLFKIDKPKAPKIEPPARMPTPLDADARERRRRRLEQIRGREGRQATILNAVDETGSQGRLGA